MNTREKFIEVLANGNRNTSPPKWEFGYWGENIDNWYKEGLRRNRYPHVPKKITTPTSSLYIPAWNSIKESRLPSGIAVIGGGLYWPTQGFALDNDVKDALGMDKSQILVNVNLLFHPMFKAEIIQEDEEYLTYVDIDGVKRKFIKSTSVIPTGVEWIIKDWDSWNKLKDERLNLKDIRGRFPDNWNKLMKSYTDRDYPLILGGYPQGYFGTLAHLMGYQYLFYNYFDNADLIHDIQKTFTELWLSVYEEVLSDIDVDGFIFWEDISAGSGSMVSPAMIREFMLPYYKRITGFLKDKGIKVIFVDTDGDCFTIIPIFIEGGVTGMYPIEVSCGMDLVKVRKTYPELRLMGGIPKLEIRKGEKRIEEIFEPVKEVLKTGGYIPFGDHLIPPEVHWNEFKYYRERLNELIDGVGK